MNFRRYYIPGSAVFITQVVQNRQPIFGSQKHLSLLKEILDNVMALHPFMRLGYVFLFDHFHMIIQPTGDSTFSDIMHSLKPQFTREYKKLIGLSSSDTLKFWQKRFWDHVIRDDKDLENHLHYMNFNPVKHGYVNDPRDWPHSSYIDWEEKGLYPTTFKWDEPKNVDWGE